MAVRTRKPSYRVIMPVVLSIILLSAGSLRAGSLHLRVGLYENPPKVFTSESGEPAGIFVDIIEEIARREGWELTYVHGTWIQGLTRLAAGGIDIMPDVAFSAQRGDIFNFHTEPVMSDWFQIYAAGNSGIRSIPDLEGKRVAVLEGSLQHDAFINLAEDFGLAVSLVVLPDYGMMYDAVATGVADAAISNRFNAARHSAEFRLVETAVIFHPVRLFFAGSPDLPHGILETIDRRLLEMKHDHESVYYSSLERWTSQPLPVAIPEWVRVMLLLVVTALIISLAAGFLMRRQVRSRTRDLRLLNSSMEKRIVERTAELEIAMERSREADDLKSAFLATMSHELRTPLNSIIGFTGILLKELAGPLNDEQRKQLGMVQSSARHLLALINDVLDISRIEAGQIELSVSTFDPKGSVGSIVDMVAPMAEKKGLDLRVDISPDTGCITTDRRRFEQIILNVLNNAVKFTESGTVRVSCVPGGTGVQVSVSDTGIGISAENIPLLFRPFQQIDSGLARKHDGTGLGLSICKRLIGIMGGTIEVKSSPGAGSVFTLRIPGIDGGLIERKTSSD
jgi:signal transduction histidine kinase